jgi:hypothetical protein
MHFRSERLFAEGHQWFFATREGTAMGPYRDRTEAKLALATFVAHCVTEASAQTDEVDYRNDDDTLEAMVGEMVSFLRIRLERGETSATVWGHTRILLLRDPKCSQEHRDWRASALEYLLEASA